MTRAPANRFELNGRNAKVSALVFAIDADLGPLTPIQCAAIADQLAAFSRAAWKQLAEEKAHCNPPTWRKGRSETVEAVIAVFMDRAAGRASTEPTPPAFVDLRGPLDEETEVLESLYQELEDRDAAAEAEIEERNRWGEDHP